MITGGFGVRIHLRPFSVETYSFRADEEARLRADEVLREQCLAVEVASQSAALARTSQAPGDSNA